MQFVPSHLRIEKGSTVTWRVCPDGNIQSSSSFYESARSHIIAFDEIFVESPKLELASPAQSSPGSKTDSFSMGFQEVGTFTYCCCIYSRMRGCIEVFDNERVPYQYTSWQQQDWQVINQRNEVYPYDRDRYYRPQVADSPLD